MKHLLFPAIDQKSLQDMILLADSLAHNLFSSALEYVSFLLFFQLPSPKISHYSYNFAAINLRFLLWYNNPVQAPSAMPNRKIARM